MAEIQQEGRHPDCDGPVGYRSQCRATDHPSERGHTPEVPAGDGSGSFQVVERRRTETLDRPGEVKLGGEEEKVERRIPRTAVHSA